MVREGQFEAGKLEQRPACMEGGSRGAPQRRQVWGPVQRRVQIQGYMSPKPVLSLLPHHAAPRGLATAVLETWKQFPVLESVALWDLCPVHIKTEPISPPWSCPHGTHGHSSDVLFCQDSHPSTTPPLPAPAAPPLLGLSLLPLGLAWGWLWPMQQKWDCASSSQKPSETWKLPLLPCGALNHPGKRSGYAAAKNT